MYEQADEEANVDEYVRRNREFNWKFPQSSPLHCTGETNEEYQDHRSSPQVEVQVQVQLQVEVQVQLLSWKKPTPTPNITW